MGAIIGFIAGILCVIGLIIFVFGILCVHDEYSIRRGSEPIDHRGYWVIAAGVALLSISVGVLISGMHYQSPEESCALAGKQWMQESCIAISE